MVSSLYAWLLLRTCIKERLGARACEYIWWSVWWCDDSDCVEEVKVIFYFIFIFYHAHLLLHCVGEWAVIEYSILCKYIWWSVWRFDDSDCVEEIKVIFLKFLYSAHLLLCCVGEWMVSEYNILTISPRTACLHFVFCGECVRSPFKLKGI